MAGAPVTYDESNRQYNAIVRKVAADMDDVLFIDVEAAYDAFTQGLRDNLQKMLLADALHLSRAGHDFYFDLVPAGLGGEV